MNLFKNQFKKKITFVVEGGAGIASVEDENVTYMELPDGLRLRFRDGEYDGWYFAGEA